MAADTYKPQTGLTLSRIDNRAPATGRFPTNSSRVSDTGTIGGGTPPGAYVDIARRFGGRNDPNAASHFRHTACASPLAAHPTTAAAMAAKSFTQTRRQRACPAGRQGVVRDRPGRLPVIQPVKPRTQDVIRFKATLGRFFLSAERLAPGRPLAS
jgi:hypothetical protein